MVKFDVTFLTKQKHTKLYEAAKRLGGQAALARELGIQTTLVGRWVNFQAFPHLWPDPDRRFRPPWDDQAYRDTMEKKLTELCGVSIDDLWPDELRAAIRKYAIPSTIEQVRSFDIKRLPLAKCPALPAPDQVAEEIETSEAANQALAKAMKCLSHRQRTVLELRYGLADGVRYTLEETGHILKATKERIRQIEASGLRKLRTGLTTMHASLPEWLLEDHETRQQRLREIDSKPEVSLKERYQRIAVEKSKLDSR